MVHLHVDLPVELCNPLLAVAAHVLYTSNAHLAKQLSLSVVFAYMVTESYQPNSI